MTLTLSDEKRSEFSVSVTQRDKKKCQLKPESSYEMSPRVTWAQGVQWQPGHIVGPRSAWV